MKKKHVLLADDNKELCDELSSMLEDNGYMVCCVYDGKNTVKRIRKERFDIVLLDLKMPEINGIETSRKIRELQPNLPIIMITGSLSPEVEIHLKSVDPVRVVYKPFGKKKIIKEIEDALGK